MSAQPAPAQPAANVEVVGMVHVALTPEGKLLLNVEPPGLNQNVALALLNRAAVAMAQNLNSGPPPGPRIVTAPPGLRV